MKTSIEITKADNGWIVIRYENAIRAATSIATDATLLDVVRQVTGISPLANVPQTVEAPAPSFQPGDTVECVSALGDMRVGYKYTVESVDSFGWLRFYEIMGPDAAAQPAKYFCNPKRFRKVESAPAPAFQTGDIVECIDNENVTEALRSDVHYTVNNSGPDGLLKLEGVDGNWLPERFRKVEPAPAPTPADGDEVPGEAEAWQAWTLDIRWTPDNPHLADFHKRFRAALRAAVEADREKRGVGGVITREQFEDAYRMFALYPTNLREPMLNAIATLGITVED